MKKSNQRGSVFTLLLKNYILFTLLLALVLFLMFTGFMDSLRGIVSHDPQTQGVGSIQNQTDISENVSKVQKNAALHSLYVFAISFIIIYCMMILLFILFLNRRIKKPLHLFCQELDAFEYKSNRPDGYQGPKEFVAIFESFDALSQRLQQSEEERALLEAVK